MVDIKLLRSAIYKNFTSLAKCAEAAGISRNVLYNIINQVKLPNSLEISNIGRACGMTADEIKAIFLA